MLPARLTIASLFVLALPSLAGASILTDDVDINPLVGPNQNDVVVTAGVEFSVSGDPPPPLFPGTVNESLDITANGFIWTLSQPTDALVGVWDSGTILTISDIDFVGMPFTTITGVTITQVSSLLGSVNYLSASTTAESVSLFNPSASGRLFQNETLTVTGTFQTADATPAVPEPISLLAWGGLALIGSVVGWRRSRA